MANPFNLIIGCGGSGLTTMAALNRLLVQNPKMLPRMGNEIYYLAVDTDQSDLDEFKKTIKEQAGDYATPFVQTIQLSHDVNILNDIIRPHFVEPFEAVPNEKGLARIRENWWFDFGGPFVAPKAKNLVQGASQCPIASYGLAWFRLQEIGDAVKSVVERMIARGTGNPEQLRNMNLIVVAGLSGGTGRGSWNLITFKVREYLLEHCNLTVPPVGIFFDANVYENVVELNKGQAIPIAVNSATGISELSCWMVNGSVKGEDRFDYRLPSWISPDRPSTDVLKVDLVLNPNSGAPVDSAYLICGKSRSAILKDNKDYHRMAGAAIYAMIAHPEILSRSNNDDDPFNSLGAATFEVDVPHIQAYFEKRACGIALSRLATSGDDVSASVADFFAHHPFTTVAKTEKDMKPDVCGTIYQRVVHALLSDPARKTALSNIRGKLKDWDFKKAWTYISRLLVPATEAEIRQDVDRVLGEFGLPGPDNKPLGIGGKKGEAAVLAAMKRVYGGGSGHKTSMGRALEFLKDVKSQIESAMAGAPQGIKMSPGGGAGEAMDSVEAVQETLRNYSGRTFSEMLHRIGYFNEDEIGKLVRPEAGCFEGFIPRGIALVNYPGIKKVFDETLAIVLAKIDKLIKACDVFSECCRAAKAAVALKEADAAGGKAGEDAFSKVFALPNEIDKTLYKPDDVTRFYWRKLVPIVESREAIEAIVGESIVINEGLTEFINRVVEDGTLERLGETKGAVRDLRDGVIGELLRQTEGNVRLADGFMEKHFSFLEVLRRNREFWNEAIQKAQGSGARKAQLDQWFEMTLGVRPGPVPNNPLAPPVLPPVDVLKNTIAASLASTCAPWWIADSADAGHSVMEFVPFELPADRTDFNASMAEKAAHQKVQAFGTTDSKGGATPFFYVAFVSEGVRLTAVEKKRGMHPLDKVKSLSQYYSKADVNAMLLKMENPDGMSVVEDALGYISPIFVRNKKLVSYRWKPWLKDDEAADMAAGNEATDLMLYAMLGNGLSDAQAKSVADILGDSGWSLPPIRLRTKGQVWELARKTFAWDESEGRPTENTACAWNKGKRICTSICNLESLLRGKGRTGKNGALKAADVAEGNALRMLLSTEMEVFEAHVLPKFGEKEKKWLFTARSEWIVAQRDAAEAEDKPVFEALLTRLNARKA